MSPGSGDPADRLLPTVTQSHHLKRCAHRCVTERLSIVPIAERGDFAMLMQNQQAFEHAETATNAAKLEHSLASLFDLSPIETVPAGKALCWEGDAAKHLFQVVEGVVRL